LTTALGVRPIDTEPTEFSPLYEGGRHPCLWFRASAIKSRRPRTRGAWRAVDRTRGSPPSRAWATRCRREPVGNRGRSDRLRHYPGL